MALTEKLTNIADAIRSKTGGTEALTLDEMVTEIDGIETGGVVESLEITSNGTYTAPEGIDGYTPVVVNVPQDGAPTAEELTFSGSLSSIFSYENWNWFIDKYGSQITFENVSSAQNMFSSNTTIEDLNMFTIPFTNNANIQSIFNGCKNLKKLPKVSGAIDRYIYNFFGSCYNLTSDEINNFLTSLTVYPASTSSSYTSIFSSCYSVRDLYDSLEWLHTNINTYTGTSTSFVNYNSWFSNCNTLDTIENMPVLYSGTAPRTSNTFSSTFQYCKRVKDIIFKDNNGVPYEVQWKSQTIDLSYPLQVGWGSGNYSFLNYNSGITADKEVKDDATYQALKDDPDWFTANSNYSRYNHDSAVNTINSLPDTSAYLATAGGTNTIKFTGAQGSLTDGGAINTLTEEEIAVATAKGWTCTFV